ncbi:hypothetical protein IMCC21224_112928 [Puniceibacterium sp. IMCC21224]|nr:hypothetical protein IMCC21224_112928 [Puniceibacterium sp. IMCC21224]
MRMPVGLKISQPEPETEPMPRANHHNCNSRVGFRGAQTVYRDVEGGRSCCLLTMAANAWPDCPDLQELERDVDSMEAENPGPLLTSEGRMPSAGEYHPRVSTIPAAC